MGNAMQIGVRGVRHVEIEMSDPAAAAAFYGGIWNLAPVESAGGSHYLRGTGAYHHILEIHQARHRPALRRIVFDAAGRDMVDDLHRTVSRATTQCEEPHRVDRPGGGYGFGFADPEGRNLAVICDVADHPDAADRADRPRKIAHVNVNAGDLAAVPTSVVSMPARRFHRPTRPGWYISALRR
jgi:hypothetical protein